MTSTAAGVVAVQVSPVDQGGLDLIHPATGRTAWRSTLGHPAFPATTAVVTGTDLAMVVNRPQNDPSFLLLRHLSTGSLVAHRRLRSGQVPLTLSALGPHLYGTGLGHNAETEYGFVERLSPQGVTWRVRLPQPAQTSPVALPGGGLAVQTEDLGCAEP